MGPAFSESEHRERLDRARQALRRAGLDGCICIAPEHLYYIGGYDAHTHFSEQALVFTTGDDEPTLVIREVDEPLANETSWVRDLRTYHFGSDNAAEIIAGVAKEKGILGKRVGVDLGTFALPAAYGLRLTKALGATTIEDATNIIGELRLIKSPREQEYIREAARYANAGMEAALTKTRAGMTEIQLAAEIDYAMRSRGSDYPAMPTWIATGPRTPGGHGLPTDRVIEMGDLIHVELAGVARRYQCVAMKTYSLGEPSARVRDLCQVAKESLLAGLEAIKVGGPVSASEEASLRPLEKRDLAQYAPMRFGVGISAAYPPSWLDPLAIIRESPYTFQAGMVFYLHTCLQLPEEKIGILIGASYLLTDQGPEQLNDGNPDLAVLT
ncbi:MAG: aminopeptidase P family protein [Chloroflexi bacterium]|nr:aminopeptidase P family protein [Chloroflexota bacterium]